ncbi:MAG: helix-turn-helix domain-containing protein [Thermoplasmata archaeon]|nr:helix-turn-helix domain-containing protein [Thermoplasmata archaeon]
MRFSELERKIGDVTSRILSKQLKELEGDGMISRTVGTDRKLKVTYALTDKGTSILPVLKALGLWGAQHQMVYVVVPKVPSAADDLHRDGPSPRPVELAKEDPLPGSEDRLPA